MTDVDTEDQGREVEISLDFAGPWTLNELVEIEDLAGEVLGEMSGRLMRAAAFVMAKRTTPYVSIEAVGDEIKVMV